MNPPPLTIIQDISYLINTFSCSFSIKSVQKEGGGRVTFKGTDQKYANMQESFSFDDNDLFA